MKDRTPPEAVCTCGYRESDHGTVLGACRSFSRSAFLTQAAEDMPAVERYTGSRPLSDQRRGRRR